MNLYINNKEVLKHKDNFYNFVKEYYLENNPATYTAEDCNLHSLQCQKGKNRSFQDMLWLCQTYFPDKTPKDLAVIWKRLYDEKYINVLWCYDIDKPVSYHDSSPDCWDIEDSDEECTNWYNQCEHGWSKMNIYTLAIS